MVTVPNVVVWKTLRYTRKDGEFYLKNLREAGSIFLLEGVYDAVADILVRIGSSGQEVEVDLVKLTGHELAVSLPERVFEGSEEVLPLPEIVYPLAASAGLALCEPEVAAELCIQGLAKELVNPEPSFSRRFPRHDRVANVASRTVVPGPRRVNCFSLRGASISTILAADTGKFPDVCLGCNYPREFFLDRQWVFALPRPS